MAGREIEHGYEKKDIRRAEQGGSGAARNEVVSRGRQRGWESELSHRQIERTRRGEVCDNKQANW